MAFGGTLDRENLGELQLARVRKTYKPAGETGFLSTPTSMDFNHRQSVSRLAKGFEVKGKLSGVESLPEELEKLTR